MTAKSGVGLLAAVRFALEISWPLTLYPLGDFVEELILADTWENELASDGGNGCRHSQSGS